MTIPKEYAEFIKRNHLRIVTEKDYQLLQRVRALFDALYDERTSE